jgi:hypothetical protein
MAITIFKTTIENENILKTYVQYIKDPNNTTLYKEPIVNNLEKQIATMFGSVARGGNAKLIPDFDITNKEVAGALSQALGTDITSIEAKLRQSMNVGATSLLDIAKSKSRTEIGIGGSVAPDDVLGNLSADRIKKLNANNGFILFNSIRTKTPALFDQFYNKAKLLQISYKIGTSIQALNAYTPKANFKVPPFKMRYYSTNNTIYLSLNDSFEKKLLAELSDVEPIAVATLKQFTDGLDKAIRQKRYITTKGKARATRIDVLIPTGGSIPISAARIATVTSKKETQDKAQQFISSAQWTALVQKRLAITMSKFGEPSAPNLKWRTGKNFVDSVKINVNYRTKPEPTATYWYNPFLDSLQAYGYRPDLQVARATREVAQQLYARKFNIIRNPSQ